MKFGFVIPLYNTINYFARCISSILNQTYKNFEIIIVDNYSTDGSYEAAKLYSQKHSNIKLFRSKLKSVGELRNFAINKLDCDYFITVDSDDYIDSNLLFTINEKLNKNKSDIVRFDAVKVDTSGNLLDKIMFVNGKNELISSKEYLYQMCEDFINCNKIFGPSWLYAVNLNFFKRNNFKFSNLYQEDFGLISFIILKSQYVLCLDYIGYYYLQRDDSITNKIDNKYKKAQHLLVHYDNYIIKIINSSLYNCELKSVFKEYLNYTLFRKYKSLNDIDKKKYVHELKQRGINIKTYEKHNYIRI